MDVYHWCILVLVENLCQWWTCSCLDGQAPWTPPPTIGCFHGPPMRDKPKKMSPRGYRKWTRVRKLSWRDQMEYQMCQIDQWDHYLISDFQVVSRLTDDEFPFLFGNLPFHFISFHFISPRCRSLSSKHLRERPTSRGAMGNMVKSTSVCVL